MASYPTTLCRREAPQFRCAAVVNNEFKTVSLDELTSNGQWCVMLFYPADFTFVCPTEIQAFSDAAAHFKALNCNVVAVSTDTVHTHLAWIQTPKSKGGLGPMAIPVLGDQTKEVSRAYGVLIVDPADGDCGLALRGTYIIDGTKKVRNVTVNDCAVGRSVDETLRLVQAFQYADANGEVCPAGWKPGAKTMFADPVKSKAYFAEVHGAAAGNGAAAAATLST
jgi:alkyl hydroperoxide reductase subunit AhpC